jgi:hypothetical protein
LVLLGFDAPTLGAPEFDAARAWLNIVLTSSQAGRAQSSMGEGAFMVVVTVTVTVKSLFQLFWERSDSLSFWVSPLLLEMMCWCDRMQMDQHRTVARKHSH